MKEGTTRGVFERPPGSGVWWISYFDAAGKWHREKIGRRSVALEAYVNRKREIREGLYVPPTSRRPKLLFGDLFDEAIEAKRGRNTPYAVHKDAIRKECVVSGLGNKIASAIVASDVEKFLRGIRADGRSGSTVNRYRSLISSIFAFGVRTGKLDTNPVSKVPRFRENPSRVKTLSDSEEKKLREVIRAECSEREAEFDLALCTGMRRGEQFTLKWADVNLKWRTLAVNGKSGRRNVTLNSRAVEALKILSARAVGSVFVCPETKSERQHDWRRWFEDCCTKAGLDDFHWHDLRHTFASRLVIAGVGMRTLQELLGHKTLAMTQRYAHLSQTHRQESVEKLETFEPDTPAKTEPRTIAISKKTK